MTPISLNTEGLGTGADGSWRFTGEDGRCRDAAYIIIVSAGRWRRGPKDGVGL